MFWVEWDASTIAVPSILASACGCFGSENGVGGGLLAVARLGAAEDVFAVAVANAFAFGG
jgi:hypothetical protein